MISTNSVNMNKINFKGTYVETKNGVTSKPRITPPQEDLVIINRVKDLVKDPDKVELKDLDLENYVSVFEVTTDDNSKKLITWSEKVENSIDITVDSLNKNKYLFTITKKDVDKNLELLKKPFEELIKDITNIIFKFNK